MRVEVGDDGVVIGDVAARIIAGPPMSMFSMQASKGRAAATVSSNG